MSCADQLLVAATDLNVSLTAELRSTNASDGGITLGAKNLHELIANAPGDEITLEKADNECPARRRSAECAAAARAPTTAAGEPADRSRGVSPG